MENELRSRQTTLNHDKIGLEFIVSVIFRSFFSHWLAVVVVCVVIAGAGDGGGAAAAHIHRRIFTFIASMHINSTVR